MSIEIKNYQNELKDFMKELSIKLGNTEDEIATLKILKTVLHSLRDSITISESLEFNSRLPLWLREIYEEHWIYDENIETKYNVGDFKKKVKEERDKWSVGEFGWNMPVEKMTKTVFKSLKKYTSNGQDDTINSAIIIAYLIE